MIEQLVSRLPEIYQPIFGHPELSGQVSRPCIDRLAKIVQIHDGLCHVLGRQLNVLDLGCAQGYFSLSLAKQGANVCGIDFLDKNIDVCNALVKENPGLQARFETGRVEDVVDRLESGQYDLVLGLSVFHHIVHEKGIPTVKALLERIAAQSGALIVELALREEPLYWASTQPDDPYELIEGIAFVHEVARYATHLAPIPRPLFVASSQYWILGDKVEKFENWACDPHALANGTHQGSRRYFFGKNNFLKTYRINHSRGEFNRSEFNKEVKFISSPPSGFLVPKCLYVGENESTAWIVTERLQGELLLDLLRKNVDFDRKALLMAVLEQLSILENSGLYHNDVRAWNIMRREDGVVYLIDCGSITSEARDCVWPSNIFLSFFIFVKEVATGLVENPNDSLREISISPFGLPQPYRTWAEGIWRLPPSEWSFGKMSETLSDLKIDNLQVLALQDSMSIWMKAIEDAIQEQKVLNKRIASRSDDDKQRLYDEIKKLIDAQAAEIKGVSDSLAKFEIFLRGQIPEIGILQQRMAVTQQRFEDAEVKLSAIKQESGEFERRAIFAEKSVQEQAEKIDELAVSSHYWWEQCNVLKESWSWRITAPLRWMASGRISVVINQAFRKVANGFVRKSIILFRKPLSWLMALVLRHPQLSYRINRWLLSEYPALHQQLLGAARRDGVVSPASDHPSLPRMVASPSGEHLVNVSPYACQIYMDLQTEIKKTKGTIDANCN